MSGVEARTSQINDRGSTRSGTLHRVISDRRDEFQGGSQLFDMCIGAKGSSDICLCHNVAAGYCVPL